MNGRPSKIRSVHTYVITLDGLFWFNLYVCIIAEWGQYHLIPYLVQLNFMRVRAFSLYTEFLEFASSANFWIIFFFGRVIRFKLGSNLQYLAKTWIYLTTYLCTERIFWQSTVHVQQNIFEKNSIEFGSSHIYASFGIFCMQTFWRPTDWWIVT